MLPRRCPGPLSAALVTALLAASVAGGCTLDASGRGLASPGGGGSASDGGAGPGAGSPGGADGSGGSGGSGGQLPPGPEKCANGVDDDGDGLVDCDDEACGSATCADGIQQGFSEYFRVEVEPFPAEGPAPRPCAEGGEAIVFGEGLVETACVGAETCGCAFGGASCRRPDLACYRNNSSGCTDEGKRIAGFPDPLTPLGACAEPGPPAYEVPPDAARCKLGAGAVAAPGACTTTGSVALADPRPFEAALFACPVSPAGKCEGGMCFAPQPGEGGLLCAKFGGDVACASPNAKRHVVHALAEHVDTRACHGCACTPTSVTCGPGSVTFFDGDNCEPPPVAAEPDVVVEGGACKPVGHLLDGGTASFRLDAAAPSHSGCTPEPASGTPAAPATAGPAYTLCCVEAP